MIVGLALVLGAIVLTAWFARRMGMGAGQGGTLLKVVAALSVGAKEKVVVLEIGGQWMVLGVAPGRVSALASLPKGELAESAAVQALPLGIDFAALIRKARHRA